MGTSGGGVTHAPTSRVPVPENAALSKPCPSYSWLGPNVNVRVTVSPITIWIVDGPGSPATPSVLRNVCESLPVVTVTSEPGRLDSLLPMSTITSHVSPTAAAGTASVPRTS